MMTPILEQGTSCWTVEDVDRAGVLVDAQAYFRAFHLAARSAEHSLLISGWQFDSSVRLLRGADAEGGLPVRLLHFLNYLCEHKPGLRVSLLAWDFSMIYTLERELLQEYRFNWTTHERLQFRFDSTAPVGASHHQKFVMIDRRLAFIGGMDLCDKRWDDRTHLALHPERVDSELVPFGPYHDVQCYVTGGIVEKLDGLFCDRWERATGERLETGPSGEWRIPDFRDAIPVECGKAALSRTESSSTAPPIHELRELFLRAIGSAEELIYVENQYFTSQEVHDALVARLIDSRRPLLNVVFVLPRQPEALKEALALGLEQARLIESVRATAARTGHAVGVYYATAAGDSRLATYIHSKVLIVDDRFLSMGSANLTNRSVGLDTELNLSWEAVPPRDPRLCRSIRRVRVSLLAEHTGVAGSVAAVRALARPKGLVDHLNRLAADSTSRIRPHQNQTVFDSSEWPQAVKPESVSFDPREPPLDTIVYESFGESAFSEGISALKEWLGRKRL